MTRLKIFFYITLAGMMISMAGCQSPVADPDDNNGEGPAVYLKVARSALINGEDSINEDEATFEDRVHNLVMLVFDSSKGNLVGSHVEQIPLSEKAHLLQNSARSAGFLLCGKHAAGRASGYHLQNCDGNLHAETEGSGCRSVSECRRNQRISHVARV